MARTQKQKDYQKKWWSEHRDKLNAKKMRYYYRHKEEVLAKMKKKHEIKMANPILKAERLEKIRKRKEKLAGRPRSPYCESCGKIGRVVFDHDHITGLFRGWLCQPCNKALGFLQDNPAYIKALEGYVVKHVMKREAEKAGLKIDFAHSDGEFINKKIAYLASGHKLVSESK